MPVYGLNAILQMAVTSSLLLIMAFAVQMSESQWFNPIHQHKFESLLSKPVIRLDQPTGVYVVGETVTITCTVTGDDRAKTFYFYREHWKNSSSLSLRTNNNEAVLVIPGRFDGQYLCRYTISVNGRRIESPLSEHVMLITTDPPSKPGISLDQWTGVYVVGETVTITCTVTGDDRGKTFHFYRGDQILSPSQVITKNDIGTFHVIAGTNGEQYSCAYSVSVNGRRIDSPVSEPVMVTAKEPLRKPVITLDPSTGVFFEGEMVTMTCTVSGDDREKTFNFYKDNAGHYPQYVDRNTGTFLVNGRNSEGRYRCQYRISIRGRHLTSPRSEPLTLLTTRHVTDGIFTIARHKEETAVRTDYI